MNIRVGNICKFEDFEPFEGRSACYKIGRVTEIKGNLVFFTVLLDIWQGEQYTSLVGEILSCPIPGSLTFEWLSRIQIIS